MLLALFISFIFLAVVVLIANKRHDNRIELERLIAKTKTIEKTLTERLQDYVMEFVTDANIPLENILVHNKNNSGACILAHVDNKLKKHGRYTYSNDLKANTEYLYVPEIKDYHQAYVWLHEIAHYIFRHNHENDSMDLTRIEYEADMYAIHMLDKFPTPPKPDYYSRDFERNIHDINLVMIKQLAQDNVKYYFNQLTWETKYLYTFAKHNRDIIQFLGTKFEYEKD